MKKLLILFCLILTSCSGIQSFIEENVLHQGNNIAHEHDLEDNIVVQEKDIEVQIINNPTCDSIRGKDAYRAQFVYKPISESTNPIKKDRCVVLFPPNYKTKFKSVTIQLKDGSDSNLWFDEWGSPDTSMTGNPDLRQTWRCNAYPSQIKDNALILAKDPVQDCLWKIKKATERFD